MRFFLVCLCIGVGSVSCFAQKDLGGKDQFPQFRTLSGLVAGGYGLNLNGEPSFKGAMAISTPVGQSLGPGRFAFGLGITSSDSRPRFFDRGSHEEKSNGTAEGMVGVGTPFGNFTVGGMILSSLGDNVLNLHFSPKINTEKVAFGVGVQDVFSTGGSSGETIDLKQGGGVSRSFYAVTTTQFAENGYISFGAGTRRFKRGFGNISYNLAQPVKGVVEYDGFNFNYGLGFNLGSFPIGSSNGGETVRHANATAFLGYVRGKYFTWTLGFSF
jgi:hypothetical protein